MSEAQASTASVLIVDSDIIGRHALAKYLRHCGYAVVEAADTDEAMLGLRETTLSIDVILCDVAVKGTRTGFELVSYVRQQYPRARGQARRQYRGGRRGRSRPL